MPREVGPLSLPVFHDHGHWWEPAPWPFDAFYRWCADYWRQHTTPAFKRSKRRYGR